MAPTQKVLERGRSERNWKGYGQTCRFPCLAPSCAWRASRSGRPATDTALVTGANHGIGAATAAALAACGASVLLSYWRLNEPLDPGMPDAYRHDRAGNANEVVDGIQAAGGRASAVEADLADPSSAPVLFDAAEAAFGQVDILINHASGWIPDTFKPIQNDRFQRPLQPVSAASIDRVFAIDARGSALLIAEFAKRHVARRATWGRIIGSPPAGRWAFLKR